jgi:hypothetical protein
MAGNTILERNALESLKFFSILYFDFMATDALDFLMSTSQLECSSRVIKFSSRLERFSIMAAAAIYSQSFLMVIFVAWYAVFTQSKVSIFSFL